MENEKGVFGDNISDIMQYRMEHRIKVGSNVLSLCAFKDQENMETIASGSLDCFIKIWSPLKGALIKTLKGHEGGVRELTYIYQYKYLV